MKLLYEKTNSLGISPKNPQLFRVGVRMVSTVIWRERSLFLAMVGFIIIITLIILARAINGYDFILNRATIGAYPFLVCCHVIGHHLEICRWLFQNNNTTSSAFCNPLCLRLYGTHPCWGNLISYVALKCVTALARSVVKTNLVVLVLCNPPFLVRKSKHQHSSERL